MKLQIKLYILFFLLAISLIVITPYNIYTVYANDATALTTSSAKAVYMFEVNTGRVIYSKNCEEKLAMASTTKIVTAITAIDNFEGDLDEKIIVPDDAVGLEGTSMYLKHGEKVSVRELLYGLMLPSGNDAGKALAIIIAGNEENFCKLMKNTAIKVGAESSNFANSHGLDNSEHYTTAKDLAKITAYALNNSLFKEIVSTKNVVIDKTNMYETRFYKNKNKLLFQFEDCIGVKTGFTDNAGRCLVSALDDRNRKLICVVLNCPDMFEESARLLNFASSNYKMFKIIDKNSLIDSVKVENGNSNQARIHCCEDFYYYLTDDEYKNIKITYEYPQKVDAPINIENCIGKVSVFIDDCLIFSANLCSIDNVKSMATKDLIKDILNNWS